jgi:hypothetical protein
LKNPYRNNLLQCKWRIDQFYEEGIS